MISTVVGYAGTALSILGVLLLLRTWRRFSRVRNWLDLAKLVITAASIAGMIVVLSVRTPLWLGAAGVGLGLVIGLGQGTGLRVKVTEKGVMARRTILGLLSTGAGIAVMQGASLLNRAGIVRLGMALSFVSIGVTAGLVLGRRGPVRQARSQATASAMVGAATIAAVVLGVFVAAGGSTDPAAAQGIACPATIGDLALTSTNEGTEPSNMFVACRYISADGEFGVISPAKVSVRWTVDPSTAGDYGCQSDTNRQDTGDSLFVFSYSGVRAALSQFDVSDVTLAYDEASLASAAASMLAQAEALAVSCPDVIPGGPIAGDSVTLPELGSAVPEGVIELRGGIVDFGFPLDVLSEAGLIGVARNEFTLRVPAEGGPIEGSGGFVWRWDDEPIDRALHDGLLIEGFGSEDTPYVPRPCFYLITVPYSISGDFDAAIGAIDATLTPGVAPQVVISGCEFTEFGFPEAEPPSDGVGTFDGATVDLAIATDDVTFRLRFTADGLSDEDLLITAPDGVFANEGVFMSGVGGAADEATPDGTDGTDEPAVPAGGDGGTEDDFWSDLLADDVEISEDDAALAALIGLLGVSALGLTSLLEGGLTFSDLRGGPEGEFDAGAMSLFDGAADAERFAGDLRGVQEAAGLPPGGVLDEFGRAMAPRADGTFDWETPDGTESLSRDDVLDRIADAREANASRDARHESIVHEQFDEAAARQRFDDLDQRSRADDAQAAADLDATLSHEASQDVTRQRVADALQERAETGGWDAIAQRLGQGDSLSREDLQAIRDGLDRLTAEQGAFDPGTSGSYAEDLWNEFAADAATGQEALAQVVERTHGPVVAWVVRNPGTTARIALGVATGGFSEGVIAPHEMMAAMEAAAARAHAEGRDLTYGEAMMAAAWQAGPGMLMGKAAELGLSAVGPAIARWGGEALESMGRSVDEFFDSARGSLDEGAEIVTRDGSEIYARSVADHANRVPIRSVRNSAELADAHGLRWNPEEAAGGVQRLEAGTIIPQSRISQDYGMSESGYRQLRQTVQRNDVTIKVRSRTQGALDRIDAGAVPKPQPVKIKTGGEYDQYIGMSPAQRDLVPWKPDGDWIPPVRETPPPNWPPGKAWDDDAYDAVLGRYKQRRQEFFDNRDTMKELFDGGQARHNPKTGNLEWNTTGGRRTDPGDFKPIAGDHDIFDIEVNVPQSVIDMGPEEVERYVRSVQADVINDLSGPPLGVQHGAHMQWRVPSTRQAQTINVRILDAHRPPIQGAAGVVSGGGDPLLSVSKDMPGTIAYFQGASLTLDEIPRVFGS